MFECTHDLYCKHRAQGGVKAVKFVSSENLKYIAKYVHMCLSPGIGLSLDPLTEGWGSQWMCVCTLPLLTDRSRWQSRWGLRPCDPQARLRTNMTQAADRRGGGLSGGGSWCVCQCLWNMPLCLPINLVLVPLHLYPEFSAPVEDNMVLLWYSTLSFVKNLESKHTDVCLVLKVIHVQISIIWTLMIRSKIKDTIRKESIIIINSCKNDSIWSILIYCSSHLSHPLTDTHTQNLHIFLNTVIFSSVLLIHVNQHTVTRYNLEHMCQTLP